MEDAQRDGSAVTTEIGPAPHSTPGHALTAQALATQNHAVAAEALATQVHALTAQALATQNHALAAQALATQAHALAAQALKAQAEVLAAQAPPSATQAHGLAAHAPVTANYNPDPEEQNIFAYKEIAILQEINLHYPFHKLALEDWERKEEYLNSSVSRREGQSNDLTNQIYSIFGIFAVFQGVVLSAVSQLKQTAHPELGAMPVCGKIWYPIALTVFATTATLVGIWDKFKSLESLQSIIHKEKKAKNEVADQANSLRREGPTKFKFNIHARPRPATNPKLGKKWFFVILFFVIFTSICIVSYFAILCDTWVIRKLDRGLHG